MRQRYNVFLLCLILLIVFTGCGQKEQQEQQAESSPETATIKIYPLDSVAGVISQADDQLALEIDPQISADGNGSLRITAADPVTVRLYEAGDLDVEDARLIYRAKLRTENVTEKVYLEMWCHFPEAGEFSPAAWLQPCPVPTTGSPWRRRSSSRPARIQIRSS